MAEKQYWLGSVGPLFYDDAETYEDGTAVAALRSEDQIRVGTAPTESVHVVRFGDLFTAGGDIYVNEGNKIILDGESGTTYFTYNAAQQRVELHIKGTLVASWTAS